MKIKNYLLGICLLSAPACLFAQKENLSDLVPFRKGNLWGLVHHDMKEFYAPVFDSVLVNTIDSAFFSVFNRKLNGKWMADVVYKGKRMWLSADKKITAVTKIIEQDHDAEGDGKLETKIRVKDEEPWEPRSGSKVQGANNRTEKPDPHIYERFFLDETRKDTITVKRIGDSSLFYRNNVLLPEYTTRWYVKLNNNNPVSRRVILSKKEKYGLVDLKDRKVIIPFEYYELAHFDNGKKCFVTQKDRRYGIISQSGKVVVPPVYSGIRFAKILPDGSFLAIASNSITQLFLRINEKSVLDSSALYERLSDYNAKYNIAVALPRQQSNYGLVQPDGKVVIPFEYYGIESYTDRFFMLHSIEKKGFVDLENNFFVKLVNMNLYGNVWGLHPTRFEKNGLKYFLFLVKKDGIEYYMDNYGNEFIAH
jgi:hypothetical protein